MVWRCSLLILTYLGLNSSLANAQTCCSGGVPLSANLGMPTINPGAWQFNLSYDLNVLETLKTGRETLEDGSRSRRTHSVLGEVGFSLSRRWAIDLLFSFVRQERRIRQAIGEDFTSTNGLGDATILLKYQLFNSQTLGWTVGMGSKLPTGSSDKVRMDGIALNADLQPGSGAFDGIIWTNINHQGLLSPSNDLFATLVYSHKGTNRSYLGNQHYRFGHELQASFGVSDQLQLLGEIMIPSVTFRFRHAEPDINDGHNLPSTGGDWLFLNPAIAWQLRPNFTLQANVDIPLYAKIVGTQVTPTYRLNTGLYYLIDAK